MSERLRRRFKSKGICRPVQGEAGEVQFQVPKSGIVECDEKALSFLDWRIPYRAIKSARIESQSFIGVAMHNLYISDGKSNYLFKLPGNTAYKPFPFEVNLPEKPSFIRRYWLALVALVLAGLQLLNAYGI